jgi:ribosomal protein S18 acetylase RimI-like enzyme
MQIRDGRPDDAPTLVELNARMALETEGKALDRATLTRGVERVLRDRALGRYFVVERAEGDVVGCLMVTREWSDWRDGHFWWIQSVYVREDARGQGVYSALHRHVVDEARRAGNVVGVRLYVEPHNARAQRTYERLGMKKTYDVMEQPLT